MLTVSLSLKTYPAPPDNTNFMLLSLKKNICLILSPFPGSNRQARGRLLSALAQGSMKTSDAAAVMGLLGEPCRVAQLVNDLRDEGLVASQGEVLLLGDLVK